MSTLREQIEQLVRERREAPARALIARLLEDESRTLQARLDASNYLRRLSDFSGAAAILDRPARLLEPAANPRLAARYDLQLSRILNLLGASSYALRVLETVDPNTLQENFDPTLEILNSNYLYGRARAFADSIEHPRLSNASYAERLRAVSRADAYFGAGDSDRAHELLDEVLAYSAEPLLQGIGHQVKAAYRILEGKLRQAQPHLEAAQRVFPEGDRTFDRGYLEKWIGAAWALQGEHGRAAAALRRARGILYRPGFKPEAWLELVYWEGLLRFRKRRAMPTAWARLLAYPTPGPHRLVSEIRKRMEVPERLWLGARGPGSESARFLVDLESRMERKGRTWSWGLNLPSQAAGWLAIAGPDGIPILRLCDALWPEEELSVGANIKRVEQVILRARSEAGIKLVWARNQVISLSRDPTCLWSAAGARPGARFVAEHRSFSRADVERHFGLSPRGALNVCGTLLAEGLAVRAGRRGRVPFYQGSPIRSFEKP